MTTAMHRALATYAATSDEDADGLIRRYGMLIDRTARRICARTGLQHAYDDLWSAGAIGLLEAKTRFVPDKGATFETFAAHRIRGAMLDEMRKIDHLPRRLRARTEELGKARQKLSTELGRAASTEELAAEMDSDMEEIEGLEAIAEPQVSLDSVLPLLATENATDEAIDRVRMLRLLTAAIEGLPERLQILVSLHYVEGLSYREISRIMDVSEPRVCQLHGDAMKKLKAALSSPDPTDRGG